MSITNVHVMSYTRTPHFIFSQFFLRTMTVLHGKYLCSPLTQYTDTQAYNLMQHSQMRTLALEGREMIFSIDKVHKLRHLCEGGENRGGIGHTGVEQADEF